MKNNAQLNKGLTALVKRLEKTEKFALDQAPEICKQMILQETIDANVELLTASLFSLLSIAMIVVGVYYGAKHVDSGGDAVEVVSYVGAGLGAVMAVMGAGCIIAQAKRLMLIKYTPKLFLLKEFRRLID